MSFKFRNFSVYKDAKSFVTFCFRLTRKFPREFYFLSDQLNRSALSVVLNIAEGSAKQSDRDFNRYIQNALGSVTEALAALEIAYDLQLITHEEFVEGEKVAQKITSQLGGLSKHLKKS